MAQTPDNVADLTDPLSRPSQQKSEIVVNALPVALPGRGPRAVATQSFARNSSNRDKTESPNLFTDRFAVAKSPPDFQFENIPGMTMANNYSPGFQQSPSVSFQDRSQGVFDQFDTTPGTAPETGPVVAGTPGAAPGGVAGATAGAAPGGVAGADQGGVAGVDGGGQIVPPPLVAQRQREQAQRDRIAEAVLRRQLMGGGTFG
jgi:hypothetical protein